MSFGWSAGDVFTALSLIAEVVSAVRDAGGSAEEYQRTTAELDSLNYALFEVSKLEASEGLESTVFAIQRSALSCQKPLVDFLENIKKYDASLAKANSDGVMQDVFKKVKWRATKKAEAIAKLRAELVGYVSGINMLLHIYNVKAHSLQAKIARQSLEEIKLDVTKTKEEVAEGVVAIRSDIEASKSSLSETLFSFRDNVQNSFADMRRKTECLATITIGMYVTSLNIYRLLLAMQEKLPTPDTHHTWLQPPMQVEDVLGRLIPIPAEFDYYMLEGAIKAKFHSGPVKRLVDKEEWQLVDPRNTRLSFSAANWRSLPGMKITMAALLQSHDQDGSKCPIFSCRSTEYTESSGGGRRCASCYTWYELIDETFTKKSQQADDDSNRPSRRDKIKSLDGRECRSDLGENGSGGKSFEESEDDELDLLKNIRLLSEKRANLETKTARATLTMPGSDSSSPQGTFFTPLLRPSDDEAYVMKAFERHAFHCATCANPYDVHIRSGTLCARGQQRALEVAQYLYSVDGLTYSTVGGEIYRPVEIEIPVGYEAVRLLLRAMEHGLQILHA